jgi:hypothetical protein
MPTDGERFAASGRASRIPAAIARRSCDLNELSSRIGSTVPLAKLPQSAAIAAF